MGIKILKQNSKGKIMAKTKIEEYQEKYQNIKNVPEKTDESNYDLSILQTELTFELVKALRIIAQQNLDNQKQIKDLILKIKELLGEPTEIQLSGEKNNDTSIGENN